MCSSDLIKSAALKVLDKAMDLISTEDDIKNFLGEGNPIDREKVFEKANSLTKTARKTIFYHTDSVKEFIETTCDECIPDTVENKKRFKFALLSATAVIIAAVNIQKNF